MKAISRFLAIGVLLVLTAGLPVWAAGEGGLTSDAIAEFRTAFHPDIRGRAVYNAVTNNDINNLALNRDVLNCHNDHFNFKIDVGGITDQKSSGRCWLFASLNALRPIVMKKHNLKDFEFSQNYLAFWDKLEKANSFLEYVIEFRDRDVQDRELQLLLEHPFGDGGYWSYVTALIDKYGAMPKEIMPETNSSGKTGTMNRVISNKLRQGAATLRAMHTDGKSIAELRTAKERILGEIYGMLVMNLGQPPTDFVWRYESKDSSISEKKAYTPRGFYKEFVAIDLSEYVTIFNNPLKPYGEHYSCALSRDMYDAEDFHYVNMEMSVLKELALKALLDSQVVVFSCDVGKDQVRGKGIMAANIYDYGSLFGCNLEMSKEDRARYFESSSDHMMALIGVDTVDGKPVKWLVENSWGDDDGAKGYFTMYDDWFDMYVFDVVIHRQYVPEKILKIFDREPEVIPAWDPMSRLLRK
ncbi:MAG: C1 family peptidase [candidate division Zixibacteria bacterium]|nr:C1 family peptidase [candidate division Zixibacteria bacterium]